MLTIFSTPKPLAAHLDVIQRNALRSGQLLHPQVEIILAGDDAGAAEVSAELEIRHIKDVARNRYGTKFRNILCAPTSTSPACWLCGNTGPR